MEQGKREGVLRKLEPLKSFNRSLGIKLLHRGLARCLGPLIFFFPTLTAARTKRPLPDTKVSLKTGAFRHPLNYNLTLKPARP